MIKFMFTVLAIISVVSIAIANDCNCDHFITPDQTSIDGQKEGYQPGDVVCLKAGTYRFLNMRNINGTKEDPIIIKNCGGQALIGNYQHYYGFVISVSEHFRISGTGSPQFTYGIYIKGITRSGSGLGVGRCSDFEIDHIRVSHTGFSGIMIKVDPRCDEPSTWRENFLMKNVLVHDNYIHDTKGEGFYIGNTSYGGVKRNCDGVQKTFYPHIIENIKVHNNIVKDTGWDGLQVSCTQGNVEVYCNTIENFGTKNERWQKSGIVIGGGASGKFYNNKIIKGTGGGIHSFGIGNIEIFNNIIDDVLEDGIFVNDATVEKGNYFRFINNTILNCGDVGIKFYSRKSSENVFYNNVIVNAKKKYYEIPNDDHSISNNFLAESQNKVKINKEYAPVEGSPLIDSGKDVGNYGIDFDFDFNKRPEANKFDIGAYEFGAGKAAEEKKDNDKGTDGDGSDSEGGGKDNDGDSDGSGPDAGGNENPDGSGSDVDENEKNKDGKEVVIDIPEDLIKNQEKEDSVKIVIYPNPASVHSDLHIEIDSNIDEPYKVSLGLYDLNGLKVAEPLIDEMINKNYEIVLNFQSILNISASNQMFVLILDTPFGKKLKKLLFH